MPESLEFLRPDIVAHHLPWELSRDEGELAVDVFETEQAIFVKTAIAGIQPEDLKLSLAADTLTIRGVRRENDVEGSQRNYLCQECHWGPFSRTIILPAEVNILKSQATFKSGLLVIKLPKVRKRKEIKVTVEDE